MDQLHQVLELKPELLELRFDLLREKPDEVYSLLPPLPATIATCRSGWIGEEERMALLIRAIDLGAGYVDLELEADPEITSPVRELAKRKGRTVIISHHDYKHTPELDVLQKILMDCYHNGGDVAKIACQINKKEDLYNLFSLFALPGRKVVLGMGTMGRISRVVAPYLGAEFTFAAPGIGEETAPGQLSQEELQAIYKIIGS